MQQDLEEPRSRISRAIHARLQRLFGYIFVIWPTARLPIYLGYVPDSINTFGAHREFYSLLKRFRTKNSRINGGNITRLLSIIFNLKKIVEDGVQGDFAELGVWKGNTSAVLAHYANKYGRRIFLFDTFSGFDKADLVGVDSNKKIEFSDTSISMVKDIVGNVEAIFVPGHFPDSLTADAEKTRYAAVSLDCDLYAPMLEGLRFFYPRMNVGGDIFYT